MKQQKKSSLIEEAAFRIKNKKWLGYSSNIARRVLSAIEDIKKFTGKDFNQVVLAQKIGVTPQYINRLVKGNENLTLETISKLSDALGVELITFPPYRYSREAEPSVSIVRNVTIDSRSWLVNKEKMGTLYSILGDQGPSLKTDGKGISVVKSEIQPLSVLS